MLESMLIEPQQVNVTETKLLSLITAKTGNRDLVNKDNKISQMGITLFNGVEFFVSVVDRIKPYAGPIGNFDPEGDYTFEFIFFMDANGVDRRVVTLNMDKYPAAYSPFLVWGGNYRFLPKGQNTVTTPVYNNNSRTYHMVSIQTRGEANELDIYVNGKWYGSWRDVKCFDADGYGIMFGEWAGTNGYFIRGMRLYEGLKYGYDDTYEELTEFTLENSR